jgi:hypothetical protein
MKVNDGRAMYKKVLESELGLSSLRRVLEGDN